MKKKRALFSKSIITLFIMLLVFCMPMSVQAAKRLNKKTLSLPMGKTYTLKLSGVKGNKVKWKSTNSGVASVTSMGKVRGKCPGTAQISGTYKGKTYKCNVTVQSKFKTGKWFMGPEGGFLFQINKVKGDQLVFSSKINNMSCTRQTAKIKKNGKTAYVTLWCGDDEPHSYTITWRWNGVRVREESDCFEKLLSPLGSWDSVVTANFYTADYWYEVLERENG